MTLTLAEGRVTVEERDGTTTAIADLSEAKANLLILSDTVLLWTDRASTRAFVDIIGTARALLVAGFYTGFRREGGDAKSATKFADGLDRGLGFKRHLLRGGGGTS